MDYLDELDNNAIQALTELSGDMGLCATPTTNSAPLPEVRQLRYRRLQASYLLRLESPLSEPRDVANVLGLARVPQLETSSGEDGEARFCRLSQSSIDALDSWAAKRYPSVVKRFTRIRLGIAHKDLSLPMIGRDSTLPHHRPSVPNSPTPVSDGNALEFPVYYLFYRTLASAERLSRLFGIPEARFPPLEAACLLDGEVRTWAGKYRALVDAPGSKVEGLAFQVMSVDQEEALRVYEGDSYEVVGAKIVVEGKEVEGRTFRFSGFEDELTR